MNPWVEHVKYYSLMHNISYKDALKLAKPSYKSGSGLIKKKKGGDLSAVIDRFNGIYDYTSNAKSNLDKYGDYQIVSISVHKDPIESLPQSQVKAFLQTKNKSFDELYHLFMIVQLSNGIPILIEKNSTINITPYSKPSKYSVRISNIPQGLTIKNLLEKTKSNMGNNKYFKYDAIKNNCQVFIKSIV